LPVFNKIDAYTFVKKDEDDLTPSTKENLSLENLQNTWIAKIEGGSMFISALNKTYFDNLKDEMYLRIKKLHEIRYPYNSFLY
jgi:GTP-binding protein HflX